MERYGFNISLRNTNEEIRTLGEKYLGSGEYEAIEVTYYENMMDTKVAEYNKVIKDLVSRFHPWVSVHISDFNLCEENKVLREAIFSEIRNCFEYAKELESRHVVMHCGHRDAGRHVPPFHFFGENATPEAVNERMLRLSADLMRRACKLAEEYGITIYTENLMNSQLIQDVEVLNRYLKLVDCDNLKLVFDVGHSFVTGHDIPKEVHLAGANLHHLHLHDNDGTGDQHACIGDGKIDYAAFVKALQEINYPGIYMLELDKLSDESLRRCRDTLSGLLRQ